MPPFSLIGVLDRPPEGLSMLGIVSRLVEANGFGRAEARAVLGMKQPRGTVRCSPRRHVDNAEAVELKALLGVTGWRRAQLDASFTDFYVRAVDDAPERAPFPGPAGWPVRLAPTVRWCPACARHGEHLLLHQMLDWERCPIHLVPLVDRCPRCGGAGHSYSYPAPVSGLLRCPACRWAPPGTSTAPCRAQVDRRLEVIAGYASWMGRVRDASLGGGTARVLFGMPAPERSLAGLHRLEPGPDWVETCLEAAHRTVLIAHARRLPLCLPREGVPWTGLRAPIERPEGRERAVSCIPHLVALQGRVIGERLRVALERCEVSPVVHVRGAKGGRWIVSAREASVSMMARGLWESLTEALRAPDDVLPPPSRPSPRPLRSAVVMPLWVRGPGALFWHRPGAPARWRNRELGPWVSRRWLEQVLLDLYTMFVRVIEAARPNRCALPRRTSGSAERYRRELVELALQEELAGEDTLTRSTAIGAAFGVGEFPSFLVERDGAHTLLRIATANVPTISNGVPGTDDARA